MTLSLKHKSLVLLPLICSLCGCTAFFKDYEAPHMPAVSSYKDADKFIGSSIGKDYYRDFADECLILAIETALKQNFDMRKAYLSVRKAEENLEVTKTSRHPTASSNISMNLRRALEREDGVTRSTSTSLGLSYQVDLFGKIEAQVQSSTANFMATAYDYLAMRLTVIETTAKAYWQYVYAKEAVTLGEEDVRDSQKRLLLVEKKFAAGAADLLDLDNARINHKKVLATLEQRHNARMKAHTALMTMLGFTADLNIAVAALDSATLPRFCLEVPAKLLTRRPDLMACAERLKKAYAGYNEAVMNFFPDFTLSAGLGSGESGNTFGRFLTNPIATLGAAITLPFLNFNRLYKLKAQAQTEIEIVSVDFVKDYVEAVAEVYDAIADVEYYDKALKIHQETYTLSVQNYERYQARYEAGLVSLTDFLNAADTMRASKISYLNSKMNRLTSTMELMSALGGDNDNDLSMFVR